MDYIIPSIMGYGGRVIASSPKARMRIIAKLKKQRQKLLAQYPYKNKFSGKAKSKPVKNKVTSKNKKKKRVRKHRPRVTFIEGAIDVSDDDDIVYPSPAKPTTRRRRITPVLVSKVVPKKKKKMLGDREIPPALLQEFLATKKLTEKEKEAFVRRELDAFKEGWLDVSKEPPYVLKQLAERIKEAVGEEEKRKKKKKI